MHHTINAMRIGIDCRLAYYRMGGISQYAIHLIQALADLQGDEEYMIFRSRKDTRTFLPVNNRRFSSAALWTPSHHRIERWSLAAELVPHRLDVMHSPDFIPPAGGAKARLITIHDLTFIHYPQFLTPDSRRYYTDQIRWAISSADHISADSETTRSDLINLLSADPEKITTVYLAANPVYAAKFSEAAIQETLAHYHLPRGFILWVGTLEPRKNVPTLLSAYKHLVIERKIDVPLVLVGGRGWIYDEIFQTIADLRLEKHVLHLEAVPDTRLAHLYRAAGVLAFPSYYEGFGLPPLEAMHAECPVITSNRGSLVEIVGDAAMTLDPDHDEAWTHALAQVLTDSELAARLSQSGLQQARQFTWEKTASATLALYRGRQG